MQGFIVTAVDVGESCNGHASILGFFDNEESAKNFVLADMKSMARINGGSAIINTAKFEVWKDEEMINGSMWTIHDLSNVLNLTKDYENV